MTQLKKNLYLLVKHLDSLPNIFERSVNFKTDFIRKPVTYQLFHYLIKQILKDENYATRLY